MTDFTNLLGIIVVMAVSVITVTRWAQIITTAPGKAVTKGIKVNKVHYWDFCVII